MSIRFSKVTPDSLLLLPADVLDQLGEAGEAECKILLSMAGILSHRETDEEELIAELSKTYSREQITGAIAFWRGAGILTARDRKKTAAKAAVPAPAETVKNIEKEKSTENSEAAEKIKAVSSGAPFYSPYQLAQAAEQNPDFKALVSFAEKRLEKVLNESEIARLYSFIDYIHLPVDVIMLAMEDCCSREKKSLRYVEKMLADFADSGITTYKAADELLKKRREQAGFEQKVRNLFGIGARKLTAAESRAVIAWQEYAFADEMLTLAYEKTVSSASKPSINYMNGILKKWHEAGWKTPEEVQAGNDLNRAGAEKSYDLDDFFEAAVSREKEIFRKKDQ